MKAAVGRPPGLSVARLAASVTAGEMVGEGGTGTTSGSVLALLFVKAFISNVLTGCCLEPVSLSGGCPTSCSALPTPLRLCSSDIVFRLTLRSPLVLRNGDIVVASGDWTTCGSVLARLATSVSADEMVGTNGIGTTSGSVLARLAESVSASPRVAIFFQGLP